MKLLETNKEIIESVENLQEIIDEVFAKTKLFSTIQLLGIESKINQIGVDNFDSYRNSLEYRFGIYFMNAEWEKFSTINDIVCSIESKITITGTANQYHK